MLRSSILLYAPLLLAAAAAGARAEPGALPPDVAELTLPSEATGRFAAAPASVPMFSRLDVAARLPRLPTGAPAEPAPATASFARPATRGGVDDPATTASVAAGPAPIATGRATYYAHPGRTASGENYEPDGLTAAHPTLPLGARVRVVNRDNGRSVVVRINDRTGPKVEENGVVIDLSRGSARAIGMEDVAVVAVYETD